MTRHLTALALVAATLALAGCPNPATTAPVATAGAPLAGSVLVGQVIAPANVIAPGGGNVIAAGGGNVVAAGGLNWRTLAVTEKPLANTEVFLADAGGNPIPTVPAVKTDANGKYTFPQVPAGHTFVVCARVKTAAGKDATLQSLTRTTDVGATADISAATTLVTVGVVDGSGASPAEFNPASFKSAVEAAGKSLTDDQLPDWSERKAIKAKLDQLAQSVAELKTAIDDMRKDLAEIKGQLTDIKKQLAEALAKKNGQDPATQPSAAPSSAPATGSGDADCSTSFGYFDRNRDGGLSAEELGELFVLGGVEQSNVGTMVSATMQYADVNADGRLDATEYCMLTAADEGDSEGQSASEGDSQGVSASEGDVSPNSDTL